MTHDEMTALATIPLVRIGKDQYVLDNTNLENLPPAVISRAIEEAQKLTDADMMRIPGSAIDEWGERPLTSIHPDDEVPRSQNPS